MHLNNKLKGNNVSRETLFLPFKVILVLVLIMQLNVLQFGAISVVPELTTDEYLIVDKESNVILAGENYDQKAGIASITKLMSFYVYADKISEDKIDVENSTVPVSDEIVDNFAKDPALSGVYFDYGDEYPLTEMFNLMLVYSDNGATKAIGEFLYGSEEEAVKAMNEKVDELGLEKTKYYNTTGLTMFDYKDAILEGTHEDDYNISTAREQLIVAQNLLKDYPQVLDIVGKSTIEFEGYELTNYNLMLPDLDYDYPGVVGLKTGSSVEAGYCFLGYYINPDTNKEYLSIVLNSTDRNKRFNDTTYLYNWVNATQMQTIMTKGQELQLSIKGARGNFFTVETNADYQMPMGDNFNLERSAFEFNKMYFDEEDVLQKTIPAGEVVGSFVYQIADEEIEDDMFESLYSEPNEIKFQVVAQEEIKKEGIIGSIGTVVSAFFVDVFSSM